MKRCKHCKIFYNYDIEREDWVQEGEEWRYCEIQNMIVEKNDTQCKSIVSLKCFGIDKKNKTEE